MRCRPTSSRTQRPRSVPLRVQGWNGWWDPREPRTDERTDGEHERVRERLGNVLRIILLLSVYRLTSQRAPNFSSRPHHRSFWSLLPSSQRLLAGPFCSGILEFGLFWNLATPRLPQPPRSDVRRFRCDSAACVLLRPRRRRRRSSRGHNLGKS